MKKIIALIMSFLMCFAFAACADLPDNGSPDNDSTQTGPSNNDNQTPSKPETEYVTVTFKQDGQADVVKTLQKGEALTDIPMPVQKTGYRIVWDRTEFTGVTESIVVTAQETANTYTVTFNENGGTIIQTTMTVTYDQAYELPIPVHQEYVFKGWLYNGTKVALSGIWKMDVDGTELTLKADWDEGSWTAYY